MVRSTVGASSRLTRAREVLADETFAPTDIAARPRWVHPRLPVSAVDAVLVSGALTEPGDIGLVDRLHKWRDEVNGFNRRLELTEIRSLGIGATHEVADVDRALNGYLEQIRGYLDELHQAVTTHRTVRSGRSLLRRRRFA